MVVADHRALTPVRDGRGVSRVMDDCDAARTSDAHASTSDRAVYGLPPRVRRSRASCEGTYGGEQQFWCYTKCFIADILRAREVVIVDNDCDAYDDDVLSDALIDEVGENSEVREKSSEVYEVARRTSTEATASIIRKVDVCGYVVERRARKDSKVFFTLDDGSGCIECVIWAQEGDDSVGECSELFGIGSAGDGAAAVAQDIRIGTLVRVQGRIKDWQSRRQINASAVQVNLDPNSELLFWLDAASALSERKR